MEVPLVLIADDIILNFEILKYHLHDRNIVFLWASNGVEAIKRVESNPGINLIFMDYMMPVMDGIEATMNIKKINPDIPVILHSAFDDHEITNKFRIAGCSDILPKPVDKVKLNAIVDHYLRK